MHPFIYFFVFFDKDVSCLSKILRREQYFGEHTDRERMWLTLNQLKFIWGTREHTDRLRILLTLNQLKIIWGTREQMKVRKQALGLG